MGGTHIVLVIIGVVLVGIAVFVGITQFKDDPALANETAVSWDASLIVAQAERWYKQQSENPTFVGMTVESLGLETSNDNGTYAFESTTDKSFQLVATGVEDGDNDGEPLKFRLTYNALSDTTTWEQLGA